MEARGWKHQSRANRERSHGSRGRAPTSLRPKTLLVPGLPVHQDYRHRSRARGRINEREPYLRKNLLDKITPPARLPEAGTPAERLDLAFRKVLTVPKDAILERGRAAEG